MKKLIFASAVIIAAFVASCEKDNRFPGYEKDENGSYFLLHKPGTGTQAVDTGGAIHREVRVAG